MNFGTFLIDGIVDATTPPGETAAAAAERRDAIMEMMQSYNPVDGAEGLIVSTCIMLHFVQFGAMRDAHNTSLELNAVVRSRAQAMAVSRTLLQWVTKLENLRKRNDLREKEARQAACETRAAAAPTPRPASVNPIPPVAPMQQPRPQAVDRPANQPPVANGRAAVPPGGQPPDRPANQPPVANGRAAVPPGGQPHAAADGLRSGASGPMPAVSEGDRTRSV